MTTPALGQCPACQQWMDLTETAPTAQLICPWCNHPSDAVQIQRPAVRPARLADASLSDPAARPKTDGAVCAAGPEQEITSQTRAVTDIDPPASEPAVRDGREHTEALDQAAAIVPTDEATDETVEVPSPFQIGPAPERPRVPSGHGYRAGIEFAKIVAGGLAGLAIAQLMLWWLPGVGRRDPLGIAQHVPAWLNVLVPPDLRAPSSLPLGSTERSSARGDHSSRLAPLPVAPEPATFAARQPLTDGKEVDAVAQATNDCPAEQGCQTSLAAEPMTVDAHLGGSSHRLTGILPSHVPRYSGEELQAALERAVASLDQLDAAAGGTREERAAVARALYERLCEVAQVATFAEPDGPYFGQRMNAVEDLMRRVSRNESLLALIGRTSAGWIGYAERTSDGIVLVGEVVGIQSQGGLWETELRLLSRTETRIRLLSMLPPPLDPRMPYEAGQRLIIMGSVGADDRGALETRSDQLPPVWRGLHYVIDPGTATPAAPQDVPRRSRPVRF